LVEGVKDYAIFTLDPEGHITSWNAGAERMKGYSAEEIVGRHFTRFYTERDVERSHPEEELRLAEEQGRYEEEGWRVRKDGTKLWANVLITALRDGEGNLRGFSKLVRDVTERRESEEALRESEERFRSAFEEAPIGVALVDLDGRRFRANRVLCDMLGCSEEDLLEDYLEHVHPDDRQVSTEHFQRTLEGGAGSYELERRYLHADGHVVWNLTSVSLVRDSKGNPKYFVCLHQDITERKEAEEKIRFQARLLDAVGEAVIATDPDGKVVYWNQAAEELYGWTAEEAMGDRKSVV
jgi:PAS domain S-box-containing protein